MTSAIQIQNPIDTRLVLRGFPTVCNLSFVGWNCILSVKSLQIFLWGLNNNGWRQCIFRNYLWNYIFLNNNKKLINNNNNNNYFRFNRCVQYYMHFNKVLWEPATFLFMKLNWQNSFVILLIKLILRVEDQYLKRFIKCIHWARSFKDPHSQDIPKSALSALVAQTAPYLFLVQGG